MMNRDSEPSSVFYGNPKIISLPPSAALDANIIRIAIITDLDASKMTQFLHIDQRRPLAVIIEEICGEWQFSAPDRYALKFDQAPAIYITEKNRQELKNGTVLRLTHSPAKMTSDILGKLEGNIIEAKKMALQQLATLCSDPTFANSFIAQSGLTVVTGLIEARRFSDIDLTHLLVAFDGLMQRAIPSTWDALSDSLIVELASYATGRVKMVKNCTLTAALNILEALVLNCQSNLVTTEREVPIESLIIHLDNSDHQVQQNALALINALFMKAPADKKHGIASLLRGKALSTSLRNSVFGRNVFNAEMEHQLYVLQTLLLNMLHERLTTPASPNNQDKIGELRRIAFDTTLEPMSPTTVRKQHSTSHVREYQKLGFRNPNNPVEDFTETPPGLLALDCMLYFAQNYSDSYTRMVLENSCRSDNHECLFARTAIRLTSLCADILHIAEPPSETERAYYEMLFKHETPFQEFFCICITLLNKTWREMHATAADIDKVMSVIKDQIIRSLTPRQLRGDNASSGSNNAERPKSFEQFQLELNKYNYNEIQKLWAHERSMREKEEFQAVPILELKKRLEPEIVGLVRANRINTLKAGKVFTKYGKGARGTREKGKFWYWRLSPNGKTFYFEDCEEKAAPKLEALKNSVPLSDITEMLTGKDCPLMKDPKNKNLVKTSANLAFCLRTENQELDYNFVADSQTTYNLWTDGINALLGSEMTSSLAADNVSMLLGMELKIRLLNIEGIEIPNQPPPVPPPPGNYDFCYDYTIA